MLVLRSLYGAAGRPGAHLSRSDKGRGAPVNPGHEAVAGRSLRRSSLGETPNADLKVRLK